VARHGTSKPELTPEEEAWIKEGESLSREVGEELQKWQDLGIHPGKHVTFDVFQLDARLHNLIDVLVESGIVNEYELTTKLKKKLLENMREARSNLEPLVKEARAKALSGGAEEAVRQLPSILGVDGKVIKH
jgi:hypothetical protein